MIDGSRWRDRRAARRLLRVLNTATGDRALKTADELRIEAWLWDVHGDPAVADRCRDAARAVDRIDSN